MWRDDPENVKSKRIISSKGAGSLVGTLYYFFLLFSSLWIGILLGIC